MVGKLLWLKSVKTFGFNIMLCTVIMYFHSGAQQTLDVKKKNVLFNEELLHSAYLTDCPFLLICQGSFTTRATATYDFQIKDIFILGTIN